ncbi:unnamed protein product, partial [Prorocentrum cordatum]
DGADEPIFGPPLPPVQENGLLDAMRAVALLRWHIPPRASAEAPLAVSGSWAARAAAGLPLDEVHRRVRLEREDEQGPAKRARTAAPAGGVRPAREARRDTADSLCKHFATKVSSLEASVLSLREAFAAELEGVRRLCVEGPEFVENPKTGVVHRVREGSTRIAPRGWRTSCGWAFGIADHTRLESAERPYKLMCEKCMPGDRAAAKAALARSAAACAEQGTPA